MLQFCHGKAKSGRYAYFLPLHKREAEVRGKYLFLMMSLHAGESSKRSLRLSLVMITPSVFCASCSMNLRGNAESKLSKE